ncbi:MAG: RNA polymerase sigma factor [Planctomycetota bacterium]
MQRVLDGQLELFEELVVRHRAALLRTALNILRNHSLAEEAVQDTFLSAYARRETFDPQYPFRGWLWTILLNACRTIARREQRRTDRPGQNPLTDNQLDTAPERDAFNALVEVERNALLHQHLSTLPVAQADALRLRFFGGLTYDEIAGAMGCSLNGAKQRVKRGLERLASVIRHSQSGTDDAGGFP